MKKNNNIPPVSRRSFLAALGSGGLAAFGWNPAFSAFAALNEGSNPLESYPNRDWERIYRDQYAYDRSFTWICAPNDTHMCRLRAFVRNGVIIRAEQNYDHDKCGDLYGNSATKAWNPRGCLKGYTFHRRVYGPYRLKGPVIRKGWKQWADDGFPSLSDRPELRSKYMFDDRGSDDFIRVTWDEAFRYAAMGFKAVAGTYSGEDGRRRLLADGYDPLTLTHWNEAGTRTIKLGSNLPLHGLIGKFGIYRMANMMALLDANVRGVGPDEAQGARDWNEYTWRGDQAPGTPYATGLQASDLDFNDVRFSKFLLHVGKNLVENKMPESHWLNETMERGGKSACITPDYAAPSAKSDYWIGTRPGLGDLAVLLGMARLIIDNKWYDENFIKRFTDLPLLVRTDTLKRLRPDEVIPDYKNKDLRNGPSYKVQGLTDEQRERIGDFCMWDPANDAPVAVSRDEVGDNLAFDPALEGAFEVTLVSGEKVSVMTIFEMYRRHLKDYDTQTAAEIAGTEAHLIERLAKDFATIKPAAIHFGEGINHYFHATLHNRACFFLCALTGNLGKHGSGCYSWAGNYKGALFQASQWSGPGVGAYKNEDPFHPVLDENADVTHHNLHHYATGEEPSYWAHRREDPEGEHASGREDLHGKDAPPHADEGHLVQQRQLHQSGEVGLRDHRQHPAQGGHGDRSAGRVDGVG